MTTNPVNPSYELLFSRGIDPIVDEPSKCNSHPKAPHSWPLWTQVIEYRDEVRARIRTLAHSISLRLLTLIVEHEAMHNETLCYMAAQSAASLPLLRDVSATSTSLPSSKEQEWVFVHGGTVVLGEETPKSFVWDNECGRSVIHVSNFEARRLPVTVGEFAKFIDAGGYSRRDLWYTADWEWVKLEGQKHPSTWRECNCSEKHEWHVLTVDGPCGATGTVLHWPVYISLAEARAYATWRYARLPTEAEITLLADGAWPTEEDWTPQWRPLDVRIGRRSKCGGFDVVGNGWELTDTVFTPFEGFSPMSEYPEYSSDFFAGHHYVLKGASGVTHRTLIRPSFRNFFQARYPYVFAKFRLVRTVP